MPRDFDVARQLDECRHAAERSAHRARRTAHCARDFLVFLAVALFVLPPAVRAQGGTIATEKIFEAVALRSGLTVCEIGAGDGELSLAAARLVGSEGRVYTSELGDERVKGLRDRVAASGLAHVTVVAGDPVKTNFPDGACDALFMRNVYHHFADPAAMNTSMAASLKPGARLAIVDFTPPGEEASRPADRGQDGMHGVSADSISRELAGAGFEAVATEAGTGRWFMVVVRKPGQS
jgi:SAM-dependent methyltransferase